MECDQDLFSLLDAEVLYQVVSRLCADDVARLRCTSPHLCVQLSTGRHALQHWLGHCRDLLGEAPVAHIAASCKADEASTWLRLYAASRMLDRLHWSPACPAAQSLQLADHRSSSETSPKLRQAPCAQAAAALLARTDHTATAAGSHLVLIGGDLRDGPAPATSDVAVLDLANSCVVRPMLYGQQPPSLRQHCTVVLGPHPGTALHKQVSAAVCKALQQRPAQRTSSTPAITADQQAQELIPRGHTLAVFGGLLQSGCEQDSAQDQLHILWLHPEMTWGVWLHPATTGPAPAPRAFSCCAGIHGGTQLLVYGGVVNGSMTGTIQSDIGNFDGYLLLCIYLLDTATLSWSRVPTRPLNEPPRSGHVMLGPSTCPGPRKKALSCLRANPLTGREEFMLLGGCGTDGLADFVPYSLNLETFCWMKGPVMGYLPPARGLCGVMRLTPTWLVMLGGQGPTKDALHDVQRLHLPTLSWRPPVNVAGNSSSTSGAISKARDSAPAAHAGALGPCADGSSCASVGCSAEACVVLGGVQEGAYGARIIPRLQILLPGPVIPASQTIQRSNASAGGPAAACAGAAAGGSTTLLHSALYMQHTVAQQPAAWHAFATTSCRCGSCCSCLAAKAAASGAPQSAACFSAMAADSTDPQQHHAGQQNSGRLDAASQHGNVPRWGAVGGCGQQDAGPKGVGAAHSSSSGCGKGVLVGQGLSGWSGEFEIEPARATQQHPRQPAAFRRAQLGLGKQCGAFAGSWQANSGVQADAGGERVWQTKSSSSDGGGSQLLLALIVVAVGLVLMAPSLMMHQ